jgi:hypothetical protein
MKINKKIKITIKIMIEITIIEIQQFKLIK